METLAETCSPRSPGCPWRQQHFLSAHCAGHGVRASAASLSLGPCPELDPFEESSPVKSPGVFSILVGGIRECAAVLCVSPCL